MLELLEGRDVPSVSAFAPGSIQGQDDWSGGTGAISPSVDQAVVQTGSDTHVGVGAWHISNDTSNGNYNGSFGGWVFSPGLSVAAGDPSSGAGADRFSATFFFRTASTAADGSNIEVDLGNTAGTDRTTFMAITNEADGNGGLQLRMAEPNPGDPANDYFYPTQIVATGITRGVWHRIDIQAKFVDGSAKDVFQVSLDGTAMDNINASSPNFGSDNWGTFEAYDAAHGNAYQQSNRLLFRSGRAPSGYGSFSDTGAQGFYIDDVSYKDWNSRAPGTILASYAATFEPAAPPSTVYVNASWAGLPVGVDPDGPGPATAIGYNAFATIHDGLNAVASGGTVYVAAGTYAENVLVNKSVTLIGANAGVDARDGRPGAEESVVSNSEGDFQIEADHVAIDGFTLTGATANPNSDPAALGAAIWTNPGFSGTHGGYQIVNNIITGNIAGIELDSDGTNQTLVQHNLFRDNTQPGPAGGTDIVVDFGLSNAVIDGNTFTNTSFVENAYGLGVQAGSDHITFSNNTVNNHGRGVYFYDTNAASITNNTITGASHYAIGLFGNNGSPASSLFTIANNTLDAKGTGGAGVELVNDTSASAYSGTLTLSNFGLLVVDAQQEVVTSHPGSIAYGDTQIDYSNLGQVNINNAVAVNAIPGPNTVDRALDGLTADERFVQALYLADLGRTGDVHNTSDAGYWVNLLSGGALDQAAVAAGVLHSHEGQTHLVTSWYQTYLRRPPVNGEEQYWVSQLAQGKTDEQVLSGILGSDEFFNRTQPLVGSGTAEERYVQGLYQQLLNRTGNATEVAYWVSELPQLGRQGVARGFLEASEFRADQIEGYYNALLHRPDDLSGLNYWLSSNLDINADRLGFEGSAEFYSNG
jgi:parallel beta-helix repeat protein